MSSIVEAETKPTRMTSSPPPSVATADGRGRSARLVLLVVFSLSSVLGVLAYWRYQQSERFIRGSIAAFGVRGAKATVEQCVDQVVVWTESCRAMIGLCDASVSRMMNACLKGQDRSQACAAILPNATADTRFGHEACIKRGVTRRTKKACAAAYRMIAAHCQLQREQGLHR